MRDSVKKIMWRLLLLLFRVLAFCFSAFNETFVLSGCTRTIRGDVIFYQFGVIRLTPKSAQFVTVVYRQDLRESIEKTSSWKKNGCEKLDWPIQKS